MKKLYTNFFYVPKFGKIRDEVMVARVIVMVVVVVSCLVAMGLTAYAYFSYNVTSASNVIKAANFETNVQIQITDENGQRIEVITSNYKSHIAELKAGQTYYITLKPTERSTAKTGFVIVAAEGNENRYHTQQLGVDGDITRETISFYLVPSADTKISFFAYWGTSSYYGHENDGELYIVQGETVAIAIGAASEPVDPEEKPGAEQPGSNEIPSEEITHVVLAGEYLTMIAERYNTTVERIVAYNGIVDPDNIWVGQMLKIPPADWILP